ncbi:hypothetical protein EDEG_04112, partial [Edhazardia aedis USNM 41457]
MTSTVCKQHGTIQEKGKRQGKGETDTEQKASTSHQTQKKKRRITQLDKLENLISNLNQIGLKKATEMQPKLDSSDQNIATIGVSVPSAIQKITQNENIETD